MQLSNTLFDEITGISELPPPKDETERIDRREHHRFLAGTRATLCYSVKGVQLPPTVVLIRDLSVGNVGFLHSERMKVGEGFTISLPGKQGQLVRLRCIVRRCEAGGMGGTQFVIGGTFEEILEVTQAEVAAAPAAAARQAAPDGKGQSAGGEGGPAPVRRLIVPAEAAKPAVTAPVEIVAVKPTPQETPESVWTIYDAQPMAEQPEQDAAEESSALPPMSEEDSEAVSQAESQADSDTEADSDTDSVADSQVESSGPPVVPAAGRNREILLKVKALMVKQGQLLQSQNRRFQESNQQLMQQRQASVKQVEALQRELNQLKEKLNILQAKSQADDQAIAELAELLNGEGADATSQAKAAAA